MGPTTEIALEKTSRAIGSYLDFLGRHGEAIDFDGQVDTEIAVHITEGIWLGNGDPSIVFEPDLLPLTAEDGEKFIKRLEWMAEEMRGFASPSDSEADGT